jgi:hypothetical protein
VATGFLLKEAATKANALEHRLSVCLTVGSGGKTSQSMSLSLLLDKEVTVLDGATAPF